MSEHQGGISDPKTELMDAVVQLLKNQGQSLNSSELLGLLSLCNLLGIVSFLSKETAGGGGGPTNLDSIATLAKGLASSESNKAGTGTGDTPRLMDNLLSMIGTKGDKQKLNPATLLTLINLLNDSTAKENSQAQKATSLPKPEPKPKPEEQSKPQQKNL